MEKIIIIFLLWLYPIFGYSQEIQLENNIIENYFDLNLPSIRNFIDDTAIKLNKDPGEIEKIISESNFVQRSLDLLPPKRPGKSKTIKRNWPAYRSRFITNYRINLGKVFIQENLNTLLAAERQFGVPVEIISAILNVETRYGANTGDFNTRDVLATLAFYHPTRGQFFQEQLQALISLSYSSNFHLDYLNGSYAGAIGIAQFLPTSIIDFAVDFDNNGIIDLNTYEDAIGSVANYLLKHGWNRKYEIEQTMISINNFSFANINIDETEIARIAIILKKYGVKPAIYQADLQEFGFEKSFINNISYPLTLVDLPAGNKYTDYRLANINYYAITRYNRSFNYATAVYELALELQPYIQEKRQK